MKKNMANSNSNSNSDNLRSLGLRESVDKNNELVGHNNSDESALSNTNHTNNRTLKPIITINANNCLVYDCMAFLCHCVQHSKIALTHSSHAVMPVWLPFVCIDSEKSWKSVWREGVLAILTQQFEPNLDNTDVCYVQELRRQLPTYTRKSIIRIISYVLIDEKNSSNGWKCCQNTPSIDWVLIDDVLNNKVANLWGPEVAELAALIPSNTLNQMLTNLEYGISDALLYTTSDSPRNLEEALLSSAGIHESDILSLYETYITHCFPCASMTRFSFQQYMDSVNIGLNANYLFNAFRFTKQRKSQYVSFHKLLLGFASLDPSSTHGELRVRFVFRYYDRDCDGYLNRNEMRDLVTDMNKPNRLTETRLNELVSEAILRIGINRQSESQVNANRIETEEFVRSVGSLQFRGTSKLCQISIPITSIIQTLYASKRIDYQSHNLYNANQLCESCEPHPSYEYGCYVVRLDPNGRCIDDSLLFQPNLETDPTDILGHRYSIETVYNHNSPIYDIQEKIREFNSHKGTCRQPNGFMSSPEQREQLASNVEYLCERVITIVSEEQRVLRVNSPAYVIGDIHGNLEDLMTMESVLWPSIHILSANYIFLGDYVDRGRWGVECVIYLFTLIVLAPNKFAILRGNHETRSMQQKYTFHNECIEKYGNTYGERVYEAINQVFDCLPVCAVIDDSIYCAHGGIPKSATKLEQINEVPIVLKVPSLESMIAYEIMWNDPISDADAIQVLPFNVDKRTYNSDGQLTYLHNYKRGTCYYFTEQGAIEFLRANKLSHIIRAHEVPDNGFDVKFGGKCVTIFSCSHYNGRNNKSAVVSIVDGVIRFIGIDTRNNAPASAH